MNIILIQHFVHFIKNYQIKIFLRKKIVPFNTLFVSIPLNLCDNK